MSSGRRKDHEAGKLPPWSEELFRAMQMRIAQELRKRYVLPDELAARFRCPSDGKEKEQQIKR